MPGPARQFCALLINSVSLLPDGVIITAHHVVEQDDIIHIGLAVGTAVSARLIRGGQVQEQRVVVGEQA